MVPHSFLIEENVGIVACRVLKVMLDELWQHILIVGSLCLLICIEELL